MAPPLYIHLPPMLREMVLFFQGWAASTLCGYLEYINALKEQASEVMFCYFSAIDGRIHRGEIGERPSVSDADKERKLLSSVATLSARYVDQAVD